MKAKGVATLALLALALGMFGWAMLSRRPAPERRETAPPPPPEPPPAKEVPREEPARALAREIRRVVERSETGRLPALLRALKASGPAGRSALEAEIAETRDPLIRTQMKDALDGLK